MVKRIKKWDFDKFEWLDKYENRMRNVKRLKYDDTLLRVVEKASVAEGDVVLDIGTGTGNLALKFLEKGCDVTGLDPSTKMLEIASPKLGQWQGRFKIQICQDPFLEIPFPDEAFDVVATTFSIHHLTDDEKQQAVKEMKRVLKPSGRIIIGDMMFKDGADKIRALAEYDDMEDEYQATLDTFTVMFEREGLAVEVEQIADTVYVVRAKAG